MGWISICSALSCCCGCAVVVACTVCVCGGVWILFLDRPPPCALTVEAAGVPLQPVFWSRNYVSCSVAPLSASPAAVLRFITHSLSSGPCELRLSISTLGFLASNSMQNSGLHSASLSGTCWISNFDFVRCSDSLGNRRQS